MFNQILKQVKVAGVDQLIDVSVEVTAIVIQAEAFHVTYKILVPGAAKAVLKAGTSVIPFVAVPQLVDGLSAAFSQMLPTQLAKEVSQ